VFKKGSNMKTNMKSKRWPKRLVDLFEKKRFAVMTLGDKRKLIKQRRLTLKQLIMMERRQ